MKLSLGEKKSESLAKMTNDKHGIWAGRTAIVQTQAMTAKKLIVHRDLISFHNWI